MDVVGKLIAVMAQGALSMFNRVVASCTVAVMGLMALSGEAHAQQPDKEFTIAIGETLTFSARGISRVFVGIDTIANAKPSSDGRQIIVTALTPGVTTMNFYSRDSQKTILVRVVGINPLSLAQEVRTVLGERSGVDVRVVNGRVLLEGEVASETFKKRIEKLVVLYPDQVLNFTTFRESFVEGAKMVACEIDFIQLAVTDRDQLGVKWGQFFGANLAFGSGDVPLFYQDGAGGAFGPGVTPSDPPNPPRLPSPAIGLTGGQGLTSYFSVVGNLNMALDLLVEHGLIKTRQHGVIVTEAGTEATYAVGGTVNIRVATGIGGAADIQQIPYGLSVTVKPIVDVDNRVKLNVDAEYSELDFANAVDGVPALRNSNIKGVVNMQEGQSVLLSGITSKQVTSSEQGWWLLSKIPILGWLFKSRDFVGLQLDNALFVTPRIYEPGGKVHKTLVRGVYDSMLKGGVEPTDLPELSDAPATSSRNTGGGSEGGGFEE